MNHTELHSFLTHFRPMLHLCRNQAGHRPASLLKGELHSNYIFLNFALVGLEWDSITLFTKINFFFLPKLTFQYHLNKIYMAFYLLTWTYFNDVNSSKNLKLKESFLWVATRKNETKLRKTEKTWKKKVTAMKVRRISNNE